ncbi:MAG: hypothetical protein ACOCQX_01555 [Candidatus Nanoarchaeia archaeon]
MVRKNYLNIPTFREAIKEVIEEEGYGRKIKNKFLEQKNVK